MINAVLTFLIVLPAAAISLFPMKNQFRFGPLRTLLIVIPLLGLSISAGAWILVRSSAPPNIILLPMVVMYFAFYQYLLKVDISKSLSVFCSVLSLFAILGLFSVAFDAIRNPHLGADSYSQEYSLFYLSLGTAAALLLAVPLLKYGSRVIDQLNLRGVWYWTIPFSALFFAVSIYIRPVKYQTLHTNRVFEAALMITCVLLLLWILTHSAFYVIVIGILDAEKTRQEKFLLQLQESQFMTQQRYIDATARERHDFRHSIHTLRELCESGDHEAALAFLRQYEESLPTNEIESFCANPALNALLNHYVHLAVRAGIDTQVEIRLPETIPVSDIDLCRITGNLLENAVTAAGKAQDKWIRLSLAEMNHSVLYIVVTNSFDGRIRRRRGQYLSTSHRGSGLGLASIQEAVEKYGGMADFHHEGGEFYSNVAIPLNTRRKR